MQIYFSVLHGRSTHTALPKTGIKSSLLHTPQISDNNYVNRSQSFALLTYTNDRLNDRFNYPNSDRCRPNLTTMTTEEHLMKFHPAMN